MPPFDAQSRNSARRLQPDLETSVKCPWGGRWRRTRKSCIGSHSILVRYVSIMSPVQTETRSQFRYCPETYAAHGGSAGWSSGGCEGMFLTESSALARGRDRLETEWHPRILFTRFGTDTRFYKPTPVAGTGVREWQRGGARRRGGPSVRSELTNDLEPLSEERADAYRPL